MRTIRTAAATALGALLLTGLTACNPQEPPVDPQSADKPTASPPDKPAALTAQGMVDQLGDLYPLPNGRDNTGSCDTGKDHPNDCRQLITTDPVSVYELKTDKAAAHWTKAMDGVNDNKAEQAGRFTLVWKAEYPSDQDAMDKMTAKAKQLAAAEK